MLKTGGTEFGPTNDALQIDNVAKVMNTLNADVYAVQVSDDAALDLLLTKISINGKTLRNQFLQFGHARFKLQMQIFHRKN
jgi:hypothetical protein